MYNGAEHVPGAAVERLFRHFHLEGCAFPPDVRSFRGIAKHLNERTELILTPVTLEGDWYRTAAGPILAESRGGVLSVILPDRLGRYYFIDEGTRQRVYLSAKNSGLFRPEAYAAATAFRAKTISVPALVWALLRGMGVVEGAVLASWCVLGGGLIVIMSRLVGRAIRVSSISMNIADFLRLMPALTFVLLLGLLVLLSGGRILRRAVQKAALAVLPGIGEREYFARKPWESPTCMADLRTNVEYLADWVLHSLCAAVIVLMLSCFLGQSAPAVLGAAAVTALVLFAVSLAVCWGLSRVPVRDLNDKLRKWLVSRAVDKRFGIQRPFPRQRVGVYRKSLHMFLPPVVLALLLPLVFVTLEKGYSAARFFQLLILYLSVAALPARTALQAVEAGRALAGIRPALSIGNFSRGELDLPPMGSVLELKDVRFSYPDRKRPVLREVSLRLHPGEMVGILGATGAGKTTLARLMTGDLEPTGGNVYYGGVELARYNYEGVLRRISYETGEDILLLDDPPAERSGRTCVVFSAKRSKLLACDRILELVDGKLEL